MKAKKYLPLKYYTNETVHPEFWNKEKWRAKETKNYPQYPEFNIRLKNIGDIVLTVLRRLQNDGIAVTGEVLRTELDHIYRAPRNLTVKTEVFVQLWSTLHSDENTTFAPANL